MMHKGHSLNRRTLLALTSGAALAACAPPGSEGTAQQPPQTLGAGIWTAGVDLPHAVQEVYPALHAGRIHLVGGILAESAEVVGATPRHVSWTPGEPGWRDETPLPQALHHPQLISWNSALYTLGGYEIGETFARFWIMQDTVWRLDADAGWVAGQPLPRPSGEAVSTVLGDALHITAGRRPKGDANGRGADHEDADDHFVLASAEGRWETVAPLPTARNSGAAVVLDGQWHVVGGRFVTGGNAVAHEVYDPREDRWRTAAPMPQGQGGLAAGVIAGSLFAFGGEFFSGDGGVYPELWAYAPETDTWSRGPDMRRPRHGHGAVSLDGVIYAIGGALKVGADETSGAVDRFTLP